MSANGPPRVAYILKRFPRLSETFILNEIAVMEGFGSQLVLFSLLQPEPPPHHPIVKTIKSPLYYLPASSYAKINVLARAHGSCAMRAPLCYLHALCRAAYSSLQSRNPIGVWKQFIRAGFVASECSHEGVTQIHAHFANAPASVAWFASAMSGIPFSFTTHAKDLYLTSARALRRRVRDARFVVTCTRYNVHYLRSLIPTKHHSKLRLVYHGIDVNCLANAPLAALGPSGHVPVILSVGRLVPKKGLGDLIAACQILHGEGIRFRCVIVGEGPLRQTLEAQIAKRGLANVVSLKGAMTHADLVTLYRESDIFALSPCVLANGDRDGIPNVIAEAMAIGVPVVSTAVSGIPELVQNGVTGLLVPSESPPELATALRRLLGDPEYGLRLARNARERIAQQFDCRQTTEALLKLMGGCGCAAHEQLPVDTLESVDAAMPAAEAAD